MELTTQEPETQNMKSTDAAMRACPRFDRCSAPLCPLDPEQEERTVLPREDSCKQPKKTRQKLGRLFGLPREGLTKKEWAGKENWKAMSEDEKNLRKAGLKRG